MYQNKNTRAFEQQRLKFRLSYLLIGSESIWQFDRSSFLLSPHLRLLYIRDFILFREKSEWMGFGSQIGFLLRRGVRSFCWRQEVVEMNNSKATKIRVFEHRTCESNVITLMKYKTLWVCLKMKGDIIFMFFKISTAQTVRFISFGKTRNFKPRLSNFSSSSSSLACFRIHCH